MSAGLVVDLIIIILAIIAIGRGWGIGWIRQFFSTVGFFGGLLLGAAIEPSIINFAHTTLSRTFLALLTTLGFAFILLIIGETLGMYLKKKVHFRKLNIVDNFFGSILSVITILLSIWLCAALLSSLALPDLQAAVDNASIIRFLNKHLPNAPSVVAGLGSLIDPNGFPQVFIDGEPAPNGSVQLPTISTMQSAINKDSASVVKVEGLGCGGVVEGSGFVVGKDLVATNAHVVAGISHPYVLDSNGTHSATPIWFDPNLDFAVLEVSNLAGKQLTIDSHIATSGTPGVVMGYPGGGSLTAKSAAVMNEFNAIGRNIYGQGSTTRSVYEIKADVIPGNSGGPLIEKDGDVLGVVFAESTTYSQVGYALTANQITSAIHQAANQNTEVSTGSCAE